MSHLLSQIDPSTFNQLVKWMGLPGAILSIFILALWKRIIVMGWTYDEMKTQRDLLQTKNDEMNSKAEEERQKYLDVITQQVPLVERAVRSAESASNQKTGV